MAIRISGVTLPKNKRIEIALTYIYGIGRSLANEILKSTKIDPDKRTDQLTDKEANSLRKLIEDKYQVEGELRRSQAMNIKRLKEVGSYRGSRHSKNLPARGQRTKTNSRTVRGNVRRTMGSGKKPAVEKT
ncbi:MAG: 30S ribosomal protein S13 [Patescibacteria group bacterium]|nr:30S ribosomal protein S13 [Patescibacteria group bacterium]